MKGINILREELIAKIYLTKDDVRKFLKVGQDKATIAFNKCWQRCIDDGYENVEGRIYYKYLLELYRFKESDIHRLAKIEREIKRDTSAVQSSVSQS